MDEAALPEATPRTRFPAERSAGAGFGRRLPSCLCVLALLPLGGCGVLDHGMLGAAGPVADQTRSLFLLVCAIMVLVAAR